MNSFRNIDPLLLSKIETLSLHPIDVYFWEAFYEFIILSYSIPLNNRFSISDLFYKLKSLNISVASDMIKVYAHGSNGLQGATSGIKKQVV